MAWNIADLFEHTADSVPDRTAVIVGDRRVTYRELEERSNRLAHHLAANGVVKDSHVGIYGYNSIEFVETMLAAYKLRAVAINVNYRYVPDELRYIFDNSDIVALVHDAKFTPLIAEARDSGPKLQHFVVIDDGSGTDASVLGSVPYEEALASASAERDFEPRSDDDIYILYTGGTTGMPKGVMWRHEDVLCTLGGVIDFTTGERQADEWARAKAAAENEKPGVSIATAPLMHGAAQWGTLGSVMGGNTIVLLPSFDAHEVWRTVEREGVSGFSITGDAMGRPLVEALIEGKPDGTTYDASSIFNVSSTAAVFSPAVKDQLMELLPNIIVTDSVGSSESGFNGTTIVTKGQVMKSGPTVRMGPDTVVLDDDGNIVEPGSGVIGRMARGGHVPIGYYKDPEKTAATFVTYNGKRYSIPGDFAQVEADGTMTLLGRGNQTINSGGEKIYPEEVESALKSHPAVFDALVVGTPDERWGSKVTAVVQPRKGETPSLEELDQHCRAHIAGYKVPRALVLVDTIPRQPSGKPNYPEALRVAKESL